MEEGSGANVCVGADERAEHAGAGALAELDGEGDEGCGEGDLAMARKSPHRLQPREVRVGAGAIAGL